MCSFELQEDEQVNKSSRRADQLIFMGTTSPLRAQALLDFIMTGRALKGAQAHLLLILSTGKTKN